MILMNKSIFNIILTTLIILMYGCNNDNNEPKEEIIFVSNISMEDLGQVNPSSEFSLIKGNNIMRCKLKTPLIKIGDEIESLKAKLIGRTVRIEIVTIPNDFNCNNTSCFSTHFITFDLEKELAKGDYIIELGINYGYGKPINYKVE